MLKLFCDICDSPMKKGQHKPTDQHIPTVAIMDKCNKHMVYADVCWPCIGAIDSCIRDLKDPPTQAVG
jgi:hypothetical protein